MVRNPPPTEPPGRWRPLAWAIGGAGVAAVCLGLGAVASHHWLKPQPGVLPVTSSSASNMPPEPQDPPALEATDPALRDSSVAPIPGPPLRELALPERTFDVPPLALSANAGAAGELVFEQPGTIPNRDVQRVAGHARADAGARRPSDAGAASVPQLPSEAPPPAPEAPPPAPVPSIESPIQYPASAVCGRSTCSVGQVCCNPSCGTCINPGESCDPAPCDNAIQYPFSPICGRSTCSVGQVCCNPSCGTCVAPGETCSHELCD